MFSNSDIHFKGNGYDFTLKNVVAHDRPSDFSYHNYFQPDRITIPQTNQRFAYFIKDKVAVVLGVDHMKYVMDQDQVVNFEGQITDPVYAAIVQNGKVDLNDENFLSFEHTDGLNYINFGLENIKTSIIKTTLILSGVMGEV